MYRTILIAIILSTSPAAFATMLNGEVEDQGTVSTTRISREPLAKPVSPYAEEPTTAPKQSEISVEDFMPPPDLNGQQRPFQIEANQAATNDVPSHSFDIGTDRNNRELVLAWERWHKQFAATVYTRTGRRLPAGAVGLASLTITVTKDHHISAEPGHAKGSPLVAQCYLQAVLSLEGNPGLTFPSGSERDVVSFLYTYAQGLLPYSGYDWKHGDVETIRHEY